MTDFVLNIAFPVIGISLIFICGLIVAREGRTPVTISNMCAAIFLAVALALWADPHGFALDQWTHLSGFGWMLVRVCITFAASLHAIAVCLGVGAWDRRRQLAWLLPLGIGLVLYVSLWNVARALPQAEGRYFYGLYYHGRPDLVYAMNLTRSVVELTYAGFGIYAYSLLARRTRVPFRWTDSSVISSPIFLVGAYIFVGVTGLCMLGEVVTDHAGIHIGLLVPLYLLSFLLAIVMFAVVYLRGAVVKPLLRWWSALTQAQHQLAEVRAATADALDINSQVDDKLVLMTSYADPNIMRETKRACSERDVSYDERLVVVAAAMIVTLRPENVDRRRQKGDQQLDDTWREGLHQLAELSSTDAFFFSDAYMVAALACGAEELRITLRRVPQTWHRTLASLLRDVLDRYDQPEHYRLAYQQELVRRAEERQRLRADLDEGRRTALASLIGD